MLVEHVDLKVRKRPADEAPARGVEVGHVDGAVGDVDGRLRDAVHVDESREVFTVAPEPRLEARQV
jgi:hypothetical protein